MTTKTDEQEREALLPCPFCNSTDISLHSGLHIAHVECGGCGAQGPTVIIQAGQPARSAWNRRAALASPEAQALRKDVDRLDWLESCEDSHGFCHAGYGDYIYYAHQVPGMPSVREVIDAAMEKQK